MPFLPLSSSGCIAKRDARSSRFAIKLAAAMVLATHATLGAAPSDAPGEPRPTGILDSLAVLPTTDTARISTWDRTGGNGDALSVKPGATVTLAEIPGAGIIHRFYVASAGVDRMRFRKSVLRMYWDGATQPDVETPLGDFFGCGLGTLRSFHSLAINVNPSDTGWDCGGMASYFAMPFGSGARITLENDGDHPFTIWCHIEYETTATGMLPEELGRFHAQWRQTKRAPVPAGVQPNGDWSAQGRNLTGDDNYVILDAQGRGKLAGFFLTVDNLQPGWYGEGDDMIFIDGQKWPPNYAGTGHEEVFDAGGCVDVEYAGPYTGYYLIENHGRKWGGKNQMYRFFINNPVHFQQSIRVTLEHGHNNDRANDYTTTAFWYQKDPHSTYPAMPAARDRLPSWPEDIAALIEAEAVAADTIGRLHLDGPDATRCGAIQGNIQRAFLKLDYVEYKKGVDELRDLVAAHR